MRNIAKTQPKLALRLCNRSPMLANANFCTVHIEKNYTII